MFLIGKKIQWDINFCSHGSMVAIIVGFAKYASYCG